MRLYEPVEVVDADEIIEEADEVGDVSLLLFGSALLNEPDEDDEDDDEEEETSFGDNTDDVWLLAD